MLPNILKETVRGIQPILIEDEMLQHREVFLIEECIIAFANTGLRLRNLTWVCLEKIFGIMLILIVTAVIYL